MFPIGTKIIAIQSFGPVREGTTGIITGTTEIPFFFWSRFMYLCTFSGDVNVAARPKEIKLLSVANKSGNLKEEQKQNSSLATEDKYVQVATTICSILTLPASFISNFVFEDAQGAINRRALGYLYGFTARAFTIAGLDIKSTDGWRALLGIIEFFAPNKSTKYCKVLGETIYRDAVVTEAIMCAEDDYADYCKRNGAITAIRWKDCF